MHQSIVTDPIDYAIIGAGAAGFFAAANFAEFYRQHSSRSARIVILEKSGHVLSKVLISGGGRCNITHACFDPAELVSNYPRGKAELRSAFTRFQPVDTIKWFQQRGVALKIEADGRVFPVSDSAKQVADCLRETAARAGVEVRLNAGVTDIQYNQNTPIPFTLHLQSVRGSMRGSQPTELQARQVLLASGGSAAGMKLAAALGHAIQAPVPSLFTFKISDRRLEGLAGISVSSAGLQLLDREKPPSGQAGQLQAGALLITHWGLSGPVVLRLSAWAARWLHSRRYQASLQVNWLHPLRQDQALAALRDARSNRQHAIHFASRQDIFKRLPQRLWRRLVETSGVKAQLRWADLSNAQLQNLAQELTAGRYELAGKTAYKDEFVTCGGVTLSQVDFQTMQSRLVPGLYFAGEVLDIDGLTGGFNFQNAWTTAWIAAKAAAAVQAHSTQ